MKVDCAEELATLRGWLAASPPGPERDATVSGFVWALSLITGDDPVVLRARVDAGSMPLQAAPPVGVPSMAATSPAGAADVPLPAWRGLGVERVERVRVVDPSEPVGLPRAWTTNADGFPTPLSSSYAEMAAESLADGRDLSGDTETSVNPGDVTANTTS